MIQNGIRIGSNFIKLHPNDTQMASRNGTLADKSNRKAKYYQKGHDLPGKSDPKIMKNPTKNELDFGYQNRYKNTWNLHHKIAETQAKTIE
jgi:hypothetical protein